jgi:hypothetical protein
MRNFIHRRSCTCAADDLERFSVGLPHEQVLDEDHAAGKYLLVPWGAQVLARCVVVQTYRETL